MSLNSFNSYECVDLTLFGPNNVYNRWSIDRCSLFCSDNGNCVFPESIPTTIVSRLAACVLAMYSGWLYRMTSPARSSGPASSTSGDDVEIAAGDAEDDPPAVPPSVIAVDAEDSADDAEDNPPVVPAAVIAVDAEDSADDAEDAPPVIAVDAVDGEENVDSSSQVSRPSHVKQMSWSQMYSPLSSSYISQLNPRSKSSLRQLKHVRPSKRAYFP